MNNSPYSFWNPCAESDRCCIVQLHAIPREHEVQCFVTRPPGPPYSISIYARFSGIARYFTIVLRLFCTIKTINNKKTEKDWKAGKLEMALQLNLCCLAVFITCFSSCAAAHCVSVSESQFCVAHNCISLSFSFLVSKVLW